MKRSEFRCQTQPTMKTRFHSDRAPQTCHRACRSLIPAAAALLTFFLGASLAHAQSLSFSSYPAGDDLTPSLGQFQVVLDQAWVKIFDALITNSPLANVSSTKHIKLYHHGVFTSPTLYDPATMIGRSDPFVTGSPEEFAGSLTGQAPGRTYVNDGQLVIHPKWPGPPAGAREIHTFLKSMHMTDSLTTRIGFSVRAGMQAASRPVSAGQVEGSSPTNDFPANSFFNVYVVVDLPAGGALPAIQLVNVDPLLVQQTNISSFPPHVVYQHENSTAVPVYFNADSTIHDPTTGTDIHVTRGTLFGQLTLAGHGVSFSSVEVEAFQNEIENENSTGGMPLTVAPISQVTIADFEPDYDAAPRSLSGGHFSSNGSFIFVLNQLTPKSTNYLQVTTDLATKNWRTIGTLIPTTNTFTFVDPEAVGGPVRFYRLSLLP